MLTVYAGVGWGVLSMVNPPCTLLGHPCRIYVVSPTVRRFQVGRHSSRSRRVVVSTLGATGSPAQHTLDDTQGFSGSRCDVGCNMSRVRADTG